MSLVVAPTKPIVVAPDKQRPGDQQSSGSSWEFLRCRIMAVASTSLACPNFTGLRRSSCPKLENALPLSTTQSFFQTVHAHLHRSSSLSKPSRAAVVAMAGSGKFFVGGNWKCNGTKDSISKLVSDLNSANLESNVDVVVAPPFIYIDQVKNSLTDRIEISAQNCWIGKGGAFTG